MIKTQVLNSCLYPELTMDSQVTITGYFNQSDVNSNRLDYPNQFVKARKKYDWHKNKKCLNCNKHIANISTRCILCRNRAIKRKPKILQTGNCLICNTSFTYYKSAEKGLFCSYNCKNESQKEHYQIKCLTCNNLFINHKSRNSKYCSQKCFGISRKLPNSKRTPRECISCGEKCGGRAKYCKDCKWITLSGDKSPFWKGGTFDYKGIGWNKIRKEIRNRDKVCQICSTEKGLDVHHIIPRRVLGKKNYNKFNQINNLILLCKKHHRETELILFKVEENGLPNMPEMWKAETIDKIRTKLFVGNVESI